MAALLAVKHVTRYRYDRPVRFGQHRLLVRPRDGHDMRVLEAHLSITPGAHLRWHFDTFGNSVADASFREASDEMEIRSELVIKRYVQDADPDLRDRETGRMPLAYGKETEADLAPFIPMGFDDERGELTAWLDENFLDRPAGIVAFLRALSAAIHNAGAYSRREEIGTQSAMTTIRRKTGTCRDFAFLFMESARLYGFAARFVTGYLHTAAIGNPSVTGGGSTHAWADVYIPGEGWREFDPTNLIDANQALIRIAVTRTPAQATPISGTFKAGDGNFLGMSVSVAVKEFAEDKEA